MAEPLDLEGVEAEFERQLTLKSEVTAIGPPWIVLKDDAIRALIVEVKRLRAVVSDLVLKHGGENAASAYGATNCFACKKLSNDYYLVGNSQFCLACWEKFPDCVKENLP